MLIEKYNKQDSVSRPDGKENSLPEEAGQKENVVPPMTTGVSEKQPSASSEFTGKGRRN